MIFIWDRTIDALLRRLWERLNVGWIHHMLLCLMKRVRDIEKIIHYFLLLWIFFSDLIFDVLICSDVFHNIPWYVESLEHSESLTKPWLSTLLLDFSSFSLIGPIGYPGMWASGVILKWLLQDLCPLWTSPFWYFLVNLGGNRCFDRFFEITIFPE